MFRLYEQRVGKLGLSGSLRHQRTHTEGTPDVRRLPDPAQRLHPRVQVQRPLGVGDENSRPLLERQVREAEQVVVEGQHAVPENDRFYYSTDLGPIRSRFGFKYCSTLY